MGTDFNYFLVHTIYNSSEQLFFCTYLYFSAKSTDWQDWYGPSGRYVKHYDINKIKSSQAYAALSDIGRNLPSVRRILELRKNATIYCQKEDKNSSSNILSTVVMVVEF